MTKTWLIQSGDVVMDESRGSLQHVEDLPKARQTLTRMLELDAPWGANLDAVISEVFDSPYAVSAKIQGLLRGAFQTLVLMESTSQLADRSDSERLTQIARMHVQPAVVGDSPSKTSYVFRVDALTASNESVRLTSLVVR